MKFLIFVCPGPVYSTGDEYKLFKVYCPHTNCCQRIALQIQIAELWTNGHWTLVLSSVGRSKSKKQKAKQKSIKFCFLLRSKANFTCFAFCFHSKAKKLLFCFCFFGKTNHFLANFKNTKNQRNNTDI